MGRLIKRVPLDFEWELGVVWEGYLNPYWEYRSSCTSCDGTGSSDLARALEGAWFNFTGNAGVDIAMNAPDEPAKHAVIAFCQQFVTTKYRAGTLTYDRQWCHELDVFDVDALWEAGRLRDFDIKPSTIQVNEWSYRGFGHDAINRWIVIGNRCKLWSIEKSCSVCGGDGDKWLNKDYQHLHDTWTAIEPPTGDGWQLWEDVSEGSPISPVFKTEMDFEEYLLGEGYSVGAVHNFIEMGFAFSMAITGKGDILSDIESTSLTDVDTRFDV